MKGPMGWPPGAGGPELQTEVARDVRPGGPEKRAEWRVGSAGQVCGEVRACTDGPRPCPASGRGQVARDSHRGYSHWKPTPRTQVLGPRSPGVLYSELGPRRGS